MVLTHPDGHGREGIYRLEVHHEGEQPRAFELWLRPVDWKLKSKLVLLRAQTPPIVRRS